MFHLESELFTVKQADEVCVILQQALAEVETLGNFDIFRMGAARLHDQGMLAVIEAFNGRQLPESVEVGKRVRAVLRDPEYLKVLGPRVVMRMVGNRIPSREMVASWWIWEAFQLVIFDTGSDMKFTVESVDEPKLQTLEAGEGRL